MINNLTLRKTSFVIERYWKNIYLICQGKIHHFQHEKKLLKMIKIFPIE